MDAHASEYAAAVNGMAETYGRAADGLPDIGTYVTGITSGKAWGGFVMSADHRRLAVECAGVDRRSTGGRPHD